jgi:transposase InsO family protein
LEDAGVAIVLTPQRAANCNAHAERFARSIKEECLGRMILFGEASLRRAIREYVEHYNRERPHQGIGNRVIESTAHRAPTATSRIVVQERLGGLLKHYRRAA